MKLASTSRKGYNREGPLLRRSYLITSYFKKPSHNVHQWTELSRTSAFLVKSGHRAKRFHLVSAAHTTHPFRFPKLYPKDYDEWLKFITEADCQYRLHLRELATGKLLRSFNVESTTWVKEGQDLVIAHLEDEADFVKSLEQDFGLSPDPIELFDMKSEKVQPIVAIGHDFVQQDGEDRFIPSALAGKVVSTTETKLILSTESPSVMGMCGGPVFALPETKCVGMVEALVQVKSELDPVNGQVLAAKFHDTTLVIPSAQIRQFVTETVETEMSDVYLDEDSKREVSAPPETAQPAKLGPLCDDPNLL